MKRISDLGEAGVEAALFGDGLPLQVGPVRSLIRAPMRNLVPEITKVYASYPYDQDGFVHHSISLDYASFIRRFIRPKVVTYSEYPAPFLPVEKRRWIF